MADELRCLRISFLVLFLCQSFESFAYQIKSLVPGKQLYNEVLHDKETILYQLFNLDKDSSYELRLSYRATTPSQFLIKLEDSLPLPGTRKLLNIDKIMFDTGLQETSKIASVTALRVGRPLKAEYLNDPVVYNIVLEKLYLGLSWETWKLGLLIICVISVMLKFVIPWTTKILEHEIIRIHKHES